VRGRPTSGSGGSGRPDARAPNPAVIPRHPTAHINVRDRSLPVLASRRASFARPGRPAWSRWSALLDVRARHRSIGVAVAGRAPCWELLWTLRPRRRR
jgi:hypothetical protein